MQTRSGTDELGAIRVPPDADLRSAIEDAVGPDNIESLLQRDPTLEEAYLALLS